MGLEHKRILVTVKAYPDIGKKYGEAVCVAGIDQSTGAWIRLYPVGFRDLPKERRFSKYATIEVDVRKSASDHRPESFTPVIDTLEVVQEPPSTGVAKERRAAVDPLLAEGMCSIFAQQQVDGTSLGVFRPVELLEFKSEKTAAEWPDAKKMRIDQQSLLGDQKVPLEKIPYDFSYKYRCAASACKTHDQKIVDWDIGEMFRKLRAGHDEGTTLEMVRSKWGGELWSSSCDTYLYVGNQLAHQRGFLVLGVFWPKKGPTGGESSEWVQDELLPPQ